MTLTKVLLIITRMKLDSKEQKIWFVSDFHYGHDRSFILNPRGYCNVQEAMTHTWKTLTETIGVDDIVFDLGDLVVGGGINTLEYTNKLIRLPCSAHYFINGNHSAGVKDIYRTSKIQIYPQVPNEIEIYPLTVPGTNFTFLGQQVEIVINGKTVVLSHYPLASWNHMSKGSYMLHGHCHRNMEDNINLKRLDLGWDWKKRPVSWEEIVEELEKRKFIPVDHHGE